MANNFKTCINGHNYDTNLSECPYCPKTNLETRNMISISDKTMVDDSMNFEKTIVEKLEVFKRPVDSDHSMVLNKPEIKPSEFKAQDIRKLVGWLVTFDLNPEGTDFKLKEGKNTIGRNSKNDFSIPVNDVLDSHCILIYKNGKLLVSNNLSINSTFLNGVMIEDKTVVNNDDVITLGSISLKVKLI